MTTQIVLEINRYKFIRSVLFSNSTKKIVAVTEGVYKNSVIRSTTNKVYDGSRFSVPWSSDLRSLKIHFYVIDGLLTADLGTAIYAVSEDSSFNPVGVEPHAIVVDIMPQGVTERIGKALCKVWVQDLFKEKTERRYNINMEENQELTNLPDFKFRRLNKVINWDKIHGMNVDK